MCEAEGVKLGGRVCEAEDVKELLVLLGGEGATSTRMYSTVLLVRSCRLGVVTRLCGHWAIQYFGLGYS